MTQDLCRVIEKIQHPTDCRLLGWPNWPLAGRRVVYFLRDLDYIESLLTLDRDRFQNCLLEWSSSHVVAASSAAAPISCFMHPALLSGTDTFVVDELYQQVVSLNVRNLGAV